MGTTGLLRSLTQRSCEPIALPVKRAWADQFQPCRTVLCHRLVMSRQFEVALVAELGLGSDRHDD